MEKVRATDFEFESSGSDAGICFKAKCPECGDTIRVAEHQWWKSLCECGRVWQLDICITGEVEE